MQPLVSICIPTYNRSSYLKKCIESLICQPELLDGRAELIITDNQSNDDTEKMCREYDLNYQYIHYYRNETDIGSPWNAKKALEKANGKLLKLSNDDMEFKKDALKLFCQYSSKYAENCPQIFWGNGVLRKKICEHKIVDFETYVVAGGYWMTWFGTFSIWKEDFEKYFDDEKGMEVLGVQVEFALRVLEERNKGIICNKLWGKRQEVEGKNVSYDLMQPFYYGFLELLVPFCEKGCISKKCVELIEAEVILDFLVPWAVRQEMRYGNFRYADDKTKLKDDVFKVAKKKSYYKKVLRKYKISTIEFRIKGIIKQMIGFK